MSVGLSMVVEQRLVKIGEAAKMPATANRQGIFECERLAVVGAVRAVVSCVQVGVRRASS